MIRHPEESQAWEQRQSSVVCQSVLDGLPVYVKRYTNGGWNRTPEVILNQARREVEIIERLSTLQGLKHNLGIINVLDVDESSLQIVTERVDGRLLQESLRNENGMATWRTHARALFLAGKWIRVFQGLSTDGYFNHPSPSNPEDLADYFQIRINSMRECGYHRITEEKQAQILDWLNKMLQATPTDYLRKVWCHGDYGPFNLIWNGRVLTPIDFATCQLNNSLLDISCLIHRLEMLPIQFPWKRWPIGLWKGAVLRGYGLPNVEELPIYRVLQVRYLICRLLSLVTNTPNSFRQRVHNAWVRHHVVARLTEIVK